MARLSGSKDIKVLQFLDAYEKQQSLWNPALESYKNKQSRDEAYLNIIRDLNLPSLTVQDVKLKVKSIRTTYTKELRALTKFSEEGKGYNPKLFWFAKADSFLKNVSLSRDRRLNMGDRHLAEPEKSKNSFDSDISSGAKHEENIGERDKTSTSICVSHISPIKPVIKPKANISGEIANTYHDNMSGQYESNVDKKKCTEYTIQSCNNPSESSECFPSTKLPNNSTIQMDNLNEDEYVMFCHSVAAQLRSIPDPYSRAVAKLKIQQILFEAETGHYTNPVTIPVN